MIALSAGMGDANLAGMINKELAMNKRKQASNALKSSTSIQKTSINKNAELLAQANLNAIKNQQAGLDKVSSLLTSREDKSLGLSKDLYNQQLGFINSQETFNRQSAKDAQSKFNPFIDAGNQSLSTIQNLLNDQNSWLNAKFDSSTLENDEGYQFRLAEGQQALDNSIAAKNGLLSGAALKASSKYNQGFASNEYQNAYNRFEQDKATRYGYYNNLMNMGMQGAQGYAGSAYQSNAAQLQNQAAQNYANSSNELIQNTGTNLSNIMMGAISTENDYNLAAAAARGSAASQIGSLKSQNILNSYSFL